MDLVVLQRRFFSSSGPGRKTASKHSLTTSILSTGTPNSLLISCSAPRNLTLVSRVRNLKNQLCARSHGSLPGLINNLLTKFVLSPDLKFSNRKITTTRPSTEYPLWPLSIPIYPLSATSSAITTTSYTLLQQGVPDTPIVAYTDASAILRISSFVLKYHLWPFLSHAAWYLQVHKQQMHQKCDIHIHEGDAFTSNSDTNLSHHTKGNTTCTTLMLYLINCKVCKAQYVGETKTTLKRRFYGHRSTGNTDKLDTPVDHNFNFPHHSITDMMLQGIVSSGTHPDTVRASKEKFWMRRLSNQILSLLVIGYLMLVVCGTFQQSSWRYH